MLKNLKSLFIVSEEEPESSKTEAKQSSENVSKQPTALPPIQKPHTGNIDNSILDKLIQALEDNNQSGFDYLEFRKALLTLSSMQMDEATKFQSTFATAATMGVTLEKLIESINFYIKVLNNEEDKFKKAIKEQTTLNIDDKLKERDRINNIIKEKSNQIKKLTEEIRMHQSETEKIVSTIEQAEKKIKETSLNFETSLNVIKKELEQDSLKLKQYIK